MPPTMYIANRRDSSKFNGCIPLQLHLGDRFEARNRLLAIYSTVNREVWVQSNNTIEAGNNVDSTIPSGDVTIKAGNNVHFVAKNKIVLKPGFKVEHGAHFLAEIKKPVVTCEAVNTNTFKSATASTKYNKTETDELISFSQDTNNYQESQIIKHVTVYPNPTNDGRFTVSFNYVPKQTSIKLFNSKGSLQYTNEYNNVNQLRLNISKLPKGVYFIKIRNDNKTFNKKILHQ